MGTKDLGISGLELSSCGTSLDTSSAHFGWLTGSNALIGRPTELNQRLGSDGYLFFPGLLARREVLAARSEIIARLDRSGLVDHAQPVDKALARQGVDMAFAPELARDNESLFDLLYRGRVVELCEVLFGEAVRHFDYTWLRAVTQGRFTKPHADLVFMGRGTDRILTAWVPLGDIPLSMGGLMVLEGSHRSEAIRAYAHRDVDTYCEDQPGEQEYAQNVGWRWDGSVSSDPNELRAQVGGRWLTSPEYHMGDVLLFTSYTVHASLDNQTGFIRLSSDSRYQPASLPADERWVGSEPVGHGAAAKRGVIC